MSQGYSSGWPRSISHGTEGRPPSFGQSNMRLWTESVFPSYLRKLCPRLIQRVHYAMCHPKLWFMFVALNHNHYWKFCTNVRVFSPLPPFLLSFYSPSSSLLHKHKITLILSLFHYCISNSCYFVLLFIFSFLPFYLTVNKNPIRNV